MKRWRNSVLILAAAGAAACSAESEEAVTLEGELSNPLTAEKDAVLDVTVTKNEDEIEIDSLTADVSALGGPDELEISPELNAITLTASQDTESGEAEIPLQAEDADGGIYEETVTATVEDSEAASDQTAWDEEIIYFLLTDRFADGNPENNDPYGIDYSEYAEDNPRGAYQGGDFAGLTKNLDYLEELGVSTVWISPIVENVGHDVEYDDPSAGPYFGYHGYWAADFEALNPHFGTLDEFHELIDEASARDMNVMVDVVLNHPGYDVREEERPPEEDQPEGFPDEETVERFDGMIRERPGSDDETMELSGLPDFETEDPDVREQLVDWQTAWLDRATTDEGNTIDSFRVDTVKHVDMPTWQHFKNELTRKDPQFKLIGESWGAGPQSDHGYLQSGTMDSLLDFAFKDEASAFVDGDLEAVNERLKERNEAMSSNALLGQFLGSHDEPGFLFSHQDDESALKLGAALQMTAKGQPVIYYGEELGQSGDENWPQYDNRYDFAWDKTDDNEILAHYKKLLSFRNDYAEILARGERSYKTGSDDDEVLVFSRNHENKSVYIGLNVSSEEQEVSFAVDEKVTDAYNDNVHEPNEDGEITVTLPGADDGGTGLFIPDSTRAD